MLLYILAVLLWSSCLPGKIGRRWLKYMGPCITQMTWIKLLAPACAGHCSQLGSEQWRNDSPSLSLSLDLLIHLKQQLKSDHSLSQHLEFQPWETMEYKIQLVYTGVLTLKNSTIITMCCFKTEFILMIWITNTAQLPVSHLNSG